MKKLLFIGLGGLVVLFLLIQLVPYGRNHTNPPVVKEPNWGSPEARLIAQRSCFDCHSNETVWPWYSNIAPVSWMIQNHVDEGRQKLNFSAWTGTVGEGGERREGGEGGEGGRGEGIDEIAKTVQDGEMPPFNYIIQHPNARLSEQDALTLIQGLQGAMAVK